MIRPLFFLLVVSALSGCSSLPEESGPGRRPVTRVMMPDYERLSPNEKRFLPEVEDALNQAGLRPTNGSAEYRLEIELEDGPVNAVSTLILYRDSSEVARSYAKVGGPSIIFSRSRIVQESFEKCLRDFEGKLPRGYSGGGSGEGRYDDNGRREGAPKRSPYDGEDSYRSDDYSNSEKPDWQRGY